MQTLRQLLTQEGRYPSRRTWERRLKQIPLTLPAQIGCLAQHLLARIKPFHALGRAAAIDSTVLPAKGGVWHKKDRVRGVIPHTTIDTEAHWTKSDYHGWIYGWKLHLITTVSWVWIPLAARLTPANRADNVIAPDLIGDLSSEIRFLLGDTLYNAMRMSVKPLRQKHASFDHWSLQSGDPIRIMMRARKCGASFICCVLGQLRTSMSSLRGSLMSTLRCRQKG